LILRENAHLYSPRTSALILVKRCVYEIVRMSCHPQCRSWIGCVTSLKFSTSKISDGIKGCR